MHAKTLQLDIASPTDFLELLARGNFDVGQVGDAWYSQSLSYHSFLCTRQQAVAYLTAAVWQDRAEAATITIHHVRKLLRVWPYPKDNRLIDGIAEYLVSCGGKLICT
jgi:hypothetical protein